MKLQKTGVALLLVAGLLSSPSLAHAEEEGSMSGHHPHDGQGHRAEDTKKKQPSASEHAQEGSGTAPQASTAHDGQGKPDSQQEKVDEGSH